MAKRTERATARKAKTPKEASKVAKKANTQKEQAAKRPLKAKRQKTSAKSGRLGAKSGAKKSAPRRRRTPNQRETSRPEMMIVGTSPTETMIVDIIEEPVPGVFVVTEFVETTPKPESTDSLNIEQTIGPESEE